MKSLFLIRSLIYIYILYECEGIGVRHPKLYNLVCKSIMIYSFAVNPIQVHNYGVGPGCLHPCPFLKKVKVPPFLENFETVS